MAAFIDEDMNDPHFNTLVFVASIAKGRVTCCDSQLLLQILENVRHELMVCDLHVLSICLCVHRPYRFPWARRVRWFIPVSRSLHVQCFPVASFENSRLDLDLGQSAPASRSHSDRLALLHLNSPDWLGLSDLAEGFPRTQRAAHHQINGSRLRRNHCLLVSPLVNLHWKSLLTLSLTWRSAFSSDQKEIAEMAAREHREIHNV